MVTAAQSSASALAAHWAQAIAVGATHLLGWVLLAATIIPIADLAIVLGAGGPKSMA